MAVGSVFRRLAWPIAVGLAAATVVIGVATTYATTGGPRWCGGYSSGLVSFDPLARHLYVHTVNEANVDPESSQRH
jgi:hypothetical protein